MSELLGLAHPSPHLLHGDHGALHPGYPEVAELCSYNSTILDCRTSKEDSVAIFVFDSIVDVIYFIDILFNFHTSYVTEDGKVVTDDSKIRR